MASRRGTEATREVQMFLNGYTPFQLTVDGKWGPRTERAYREANFIVRTSVDVILRRFGASASALRAEAAFEGALKKDVSDARSMKYVDPTMVELVKRIADQYGVPRDTALRICYLESRFKPNAKSPTGAKGLFQFTSVATKDVLQRGSPPFNLRGLEYDPEANATAGMIYIKIVAKDLKLPLTDAAGIYMGFNIGPGAARQYQRGNVTPEIAKLINLQAYGPPEVYGARLAAAIQNVPVLA